MLPQFLRNIFVTPQPNTPNIPKIVAVPSVAPLRQESPMVAATISDTSINLIVDKEVTGEAYYDRHYEHFEWPEGASGPTIAIGYDCGYVSPGEARIDWDGIVDQATIEAIVSACGLKGEAAHAFVRAHGNSVTIPWDPAITEFKRRMVPQWIARVQNSLKNTDKLSPDSLGALVSLAYNRGCSFNLPGARFAEMNSIRKHMAAQDFAAIPADMLSMQRLWPSTSGLRQRRADEAALFKKGLTASPIASTKAA
jgi:hypothetical protein